MSALQVIRIKRRHSDQFRVQIRQCVPYADQVFRVEEDQKVQVTAEFGRTVKYARLAAHEQRSRATLPDRRKGSEYRALVQAILPARDRSPIALMIPGIVPPGSGDTNRPTPHPLALPRSRPYFTRSGLLCHPHLRVQSRTSTDLFLQPVARGLSEPRRHLKL